MSKINYDVPLHRKFGFAARKEKAEIELELREKGVPSCAILFEVERIYMARHKDDPTYREKSEARRKQYATASEKTQFTPGELAAIAERFSGANDDVGMSIATKALALFSASTKTPKSDDG